MAQTLGYTLNYQTTQSYTAGGTIPVGSACKMDSTAGQVVVCTAATDAFIGIAQQDATSGQTVNLVVGGPAYALLGGSVTPATSVLTPTTDGSLIAWTATGSKAQCAKAFNFSGALTLTSGSLVLVNVLAGNVVD